MRHVPPAVRRRRLAAILSLVLFGSLTVLFLVLDLPDQSAGNVSGSMVASSNSALLWESGAPSSSLDEWLTVSFSDLPSAFADHQNGWSLVASRTETPDHDSACVLRTWNAGDEHPGSDFLLIPRSAECLDAGPWHVFVVNDEAGHKLNGVLDIANGPASVELVATVSETGNRGAVEAEIAVHRPASDDGFDGLHERPLDVWLTDGKDVCVASAAPLSMDRMTARTGKSWDQQSHRVRLELSAFQRVRDYNPFEGDGDVKESAAVRTRGNCSMNEGTYDVLVGPTERAYAKTNQLKVHARPAQISTTPIVVSIPAGEVTESHFSLRNYSEQAVRWTAGPATSSASDWIIGSRDQELKGKARDRGLLTFSSHDLTPGLYTTDVVVQVDDYYGTEVRIPVEMRVLRARATTAGSIDSESVVPESFAIGNYPNPFSSSTTIRLEIQEAGQVTINVYDMTGREVAVVANDHFSIGVHEFRFDANNLASGSYMLRVVTPHGQKTETMTLVR